MILLIISLFVFGMLGSDAASVKPIRYNCNLVLNDHFPLRFPLIWNDSGIIYPAQINANGTWAIPISGNTDVKVGCTENTLQNFQEQEKFISCKKDGTLTTSKGPTDFSGMGCKEMVEETINFSNMGCKDMVKETIEESGRCYNDHSAIDITFKTDSTEFPLINICHDIDLGETIMASHMIHGAALNPLEVSNSRPSFKTAQFYKKFSANTAYTQSNQVKTVASLVGSTALAQKYINVSQSFYFARGHLAPDGDFVHVYEQNATYYYVNVIPQWQAINNGNWKALEVALRHYAISNLVNLEVWTGGKGVMKLNDVNGKSVDIYLAEDSSDNKLLPVPQIAWKIVKDAKRNAAVAIFMLNNPHLTTVLNSDIICPDICDKISWVTWDTKSIQKGYTYCCDVGTIKNVLPQAPKLGNVGVLN